jgi:hypothetical protein
MDLTFLFASMPLVKTIIQRDGVLNKIAYPNAYQFTSETLNVTDAVSLFDVIKAHAENPMGPCLLSGPILYPLDQQSRAGSTNSSALRQLVVFDLDDAKFNTPDEYLTTIGLDDVSYTVQYSASHGLKKTLSCHIFMMLDKPVPAPKLKTWLTWLNLKNEALKNAITLNTAGHALHYSIDITACQNDKLIFIANPKFVGMKDPCKVPRIQFIKRTHNTLSNTRIPEHSLDALKKQAKELRNALRVAQGMAPITIKATMQGEYMVQKGVGEVTITGMKDDRGFRYFNLNGGDSWAYYHPLNNFDLIHSFKGEESMLTKEIAPDYYAEQVRLRDDQNASPIEDGDMILAFRNKFTAEYHCLTYSDKKLEIIPAKNKDQLADFMASKGRSLPSFIPIWEMKYNPHSNVIIDQDNHTINTFCPSVYMDPANQIEGEWPRIKMFIESAVGTGEVFDFFINWLAVIFQYRVKTQTAQVWHGIQGTGKGKVVSLILQPLFGKQNVVSMMASSLDEDFNAIMERALIIFVDEIEADMFSNAPKFESKLRRWITEDSIDIRRMRTDMYTVDSYINLIFASNKNKPVSIPPLDRRTNVGQFQTKRFLPTDDQHDGIASELPAFAHYLQNYEASIPRARSILDTEDRREIQRISINSIDELAIGLLKGNFEVIARAMPDERLMNESGLINPTASAFIHIVKRCSTEKISRITRDELAVIFEHCIGHAPEGKNKFTSYLRHHGIHTRRLKINGLSEYGIEVEWQPHDFVYEKQPLRAIKGRS